MSSKPSKTLLLPADYAQWLASLKSQISGARQRAVLSANREQIRLYHRIGSEILERQQRQGWGAKVIGRLSSDLQEAFPEMKGFSTRNLNYMRLFAEQCPTGLIVQQSAAQLGQQSADQLPWFHIVILLTKLSDHADREWYARQAIANGWPRVTLELHIKNRLRLRQGAAITNFESRLPAPHANLAHETSKIPTTSTFSDWATRPMSAILRTPSSATSPASCWSWARALPSLANNSASWWRATSSSSTCSSTTRG